MRPVTLPSASRQRFILRKVDIVGNTVIDDRLIRAVVAPYIGKAVTIADLETIRRRFTRLYIDRGYINSGAVLPDQNVTNGVVAYRFVEGRVTGIDVTGTDHFRPEYFSSRLARAAEPPFNIGNLEEEQQILLQDPLISRLNLSLCRGWRRAKRGSTPTCSRPAAIRCRRRSPTTSRRPSEKSAVSCRAASPTFWASATC